MTEADLVLFQSTLAKIGENDDDLTRRDKRALKQPTEKVIPETIFTWHLNAHTIFEDETDPSLRRQGVRLRRVGVNEGGRLSETQIAHEEKRLGIKLPLPWREVYHHFNGGWSLTLYWGDLNAPKQKDPVAIPYSGHEYLALQDVGPLRDFVREDFPEEDHSRIDNGLIAFAYNDGVGFLLDYRQTDDPKVASFYISEYDDDPLGEWQNNSFWWPNMRVFFHGLYIQDRII